MLASQYTLSFESPKPVEYSDLRVKVNWDKAGLNILETSLENSLFHVCIRLHGALIAMGRVIGDGAMFFYIQDVIVDPDYQNQDLGDVLMVNIESYLAEVVTQGATIGLLAAKGKESFYKRSGYQDRTGDPLGRGMCKFI